MTVEVRPNGSVRVLVEHVEGRDYPELLADAHQAISQAWVAAALEQVLADEQMRDRVRRGEDVGPAELDPQPALLH